MQKTLAVHEKELCKYFEPGNHVKVVSGTQEGSTGMVVKVEQHVLIILSDTTKEHVSDLLYFWFVSFFILEFHFYCVLMLAYCLQIRVFADDVVESSEVTTGVTRIGDYELHDLVLLE